MRTPKLLLVSLALVACGEATPDADSPPNATPPAPAQRRVFSDPDVERIYTRMMETLAPEDGWSAVRYVEFDWMVQRIEGEPLRRSHRWDVWSGDYRLEFPVEGRQVEASFNVSRPRLGQVSVDGTPQSGEESVTWLARANAVFINDTYWLLMPYKWTDPGVHASYLGQREEGGKTWELVELTFEPGVGLTPDNVYQAWVNTETGIMERWFYFRDRDDDRPIVTGWTNWQHFGPIMLSDQRPNDEGVSRIYFENIRVETEVPAGAFDETGA